ncbi:MAG: hypothetical protein IPK26_14135 [Planctomycetes bacterium]|nr:hypothetical protein [Planctomycetota bacterium]
MKHPLLVVSLLLGIAIAQEPVAKKPPVLPVREVTVFKDGHAYLIREAPLPDGAGAIVLDELPVPVLGTFWPFATGAARLVAAKSGHDTVATDRPAMDFRQIARANSGKDVTIVTADKERIDGRLLGVPSLKDVPAASDGELLLLQTGSGTRVLALSQVRDLEVRGEFVPRIRGEEQQARLTLQIAGGGAGATVGVMYVQRGLRWIPAYRLDIDGKGQAAVQFEATLVNDLVDLERATVNLVVGVPKFEFQGLVDPISLQQEAAAVAAMAPQSQRFSNALSNSLMTQAAWHGQQQEQESRPAVAGAEAQEDLFVFTVRDVTLKRGERLVLPIASFALTYRDVHRLEIPFAPPMEVRQGLQSERVVELAKQLAAPKARHVLRLKNGSDAPLTTAPALVLTAGRVLAQGRMSYTPRGGETDLEINVAVDVQVDTEEREQKRDPGPFRFGDDNYARVDIAGSIALQNHKSQPIEIEVTRRALGLADAIGQDGSNKQLDLVQAWQDGGAPGWWSWWNWPYWWFQHNGFAEFRWTVKLAPGAATKLEASWHYFWR